MREKISGHHVNRQRDRLGQYVKHEILTEVEIVVVVSV